MSTPHVRKNRTTEKAAGREASAVERLVMFLRVRIKWFFSKQEQTVFKDLNFIGNGIELSEFNITKNGVFYKNNVRYVIENCRFTET